jgi:anti-sigma regulatory factor (Ser/Thr protein kinase)
MGLPNVKNVVDTFFIESDVRGTTVSCIINLIPKEEDHS